MITGLLMLATALVVVAGFSLRRWQDRRDDLRSLAAALRGEMMAARSICKARISKIEEDGTEESTSWPRLRTLVFQAYVGKLGLLGAELSRQIASIYGQASDYAAYYRAQEGRSETASKKRALEALVSHIDAVNARLAIVEETGNLKAAMPTSLNGLTLRLAARPTRKLPPATGGGSEPPSTDNDETNNSEETSGSHTRAPENKAMPRKMSADMAQGLAAAKEAFVAHHNKPRPAAPLPEQEKKSTTPKPQPKNAAPKAATPAKKQAKNGADATPVQEAKKMAIDLAAPVLQKLASLKDRAVLPSRNHSLTYDEFTIPDYANLTEEEIEALLFAEEEGTTNLSRNKTRLS